MINLGRLFKCLASGSCLALPLTPSQVNEVKPALLGRPIRVSLLVVYHEDGVTARTPVVLIGRGNNSRPLSLHQPFVDRVNVLNLANLGPTNDHLAIGHLSQLEILA